MDSFEKVYPNIEELSKINNNQTCSECSATFTSESNLNLHLAKTHNKPKLLQPTNKNKIYHCPITTCSYNKVAHFKQLKFLKQHYLKVHTERTYICKLCKKGFPTEATCNRHVEYCDVVFKCCDCEMFYGCYETLKTHGRRKKHRILEKVAYKQSSSVILSNPRSEEVLSSNKMKLLLPKPSNSIGVIIISDISEQSCQTDKLGQNSQQTQTVLATRMPHFTVETQTIGDYFTKRAEPTSILLKTAKTQTIIKDPVNVSCNTSYNFEDCALNMVQEVRRSSSSTQTTIFAEPEQIYSSTSTHDSIHTDTSDLLTDTLDSNFFNCSMETQTDFIFNDELFKYCDDYTNMYTQTCDDLLLGEIGLSDTQTQTVFDDVLKSVESQTIMSQSQRIRMSCKDNVTHMQTQTDSHFKQMLEEINA